MNNTGTATVVHHSSRAPPLRNRPVRFLIRLALTSFALLWLAQVFTVDIVGRLLPAFRAEVAALDENISIFSLELAQDGPSSIVRLRANLLRPIYVGRYVVYPLGWDPRPKGLYQVFLSTRGVLQASLVFLIVVLSWPHKGLRELMVRLAVALPVTLLLIAIDAPLELLGNFQHIVSHDVDPHGFHAIFAWDKFFEGGGNCVLALAFAALAIVSATPASAKKTGLLDENN